MSVLTTAPKITSVRIDGLDGLNLPVISHFIDSDANDDNPYFRQSQINVNDKYYVKSITGLEPPEQTIAIAKTASGGKYQGKSSADREVVVLMGLNPDESLGETPKLLRDNLYTMMSTGYDPKVMITLMSTIFPICNVAAYVSKFEAGIFEKDPIVQITFTCLDPVFKALAAISYPPSMLNEKHPNVYNFGTSETGFTFAVKFTDDMDGWFIKQAEDQSIGMVFDHAFLDKDILSVSTIPGNRYVHLKHYRGKILNKMGMLTAASEWITLHPGGNRFVMPGSTSKWAWQGSLAFTAQYWGV